jgi:hypothetical protein
MAKFDLDRTQELAELFTVEGDSRDEAWEQKFYAAVPEATLMAFDPQVSQGPDHFPYFGLAIPDPGPVTPFCVTHILDDCLDNGFGITVWLDSKRSGGPEWVFSYGDLVCYSLLGTFDNPEPGAGPVKQVLEEDHQVLVGSPAEDYLPSRARKVMGSFVRHFFKHPDPRVAMVVDPKLTPARNLMVNLTLSQYGGDEKKLGSAIRYLSWFLPRGYAVIAMPDGWDDSTFAPLA